MIADDGMVQNSIKQYISKTFIPRDLHNEQMYECILAVLSVDLNLLDYNLFNKQDQYSQFIKMHIHNILYYMLPFQLSSNRIYFV